MLVRHSLRKEMEKALWEKTNKEVQAELEICGLLEKISNLIANPSKWWGILKEMLWPDDERGRENFTKLWSGFNEEERQEIAALLAGVDLSILEERWHVGVFLGQMMWALQAVKSATLISYSFLEKQSQDVGSLIWKLGKCRDELGQNLTHLKERLLESTNEGQEKIELIEKVEEIFQLSQPDGVSEHSRIKAIENTAQEKLTSVFGFVEGKLRQISESMKATLEKLPDPQDMPCQKALELAIAIHKEGRYPETVEELTAKEHFSYPYHCRRTEACAALSNLHSVGLGKHLDNEEQYAKAEAAFKIMQSG